MIILTFLLCLASGPAVTAVDTTSAWRELAVGLEIRVLNAKQSSPVGNSRITVVRIDPELWELDLVGRSRTPDKLGSATAREWCRRHNLTAAINAGMFATDHKTHVGYMKCRGHVNNDYANVYKSVAAFDPKDSGKLPLFHIFDLDAPGIDIPAIGSDYGSLVQNLRLVKRPGINVWKPHDRMWSEAALGEDGSGRILFIFTRSPFSMHDLNRELLSSGIDLRAAQHLEGGPEAQLYLHVGDVEMEMCGSYETSFQETDLNSNSWPIPNVIGIRPRMTKP